ncbi:hypothetical protein BSL78_22158 [Apostichopus japonicus]|uniref:Uncharacterized protein n=2 Tax=Stichopus japonicus TaxID=307972 RepID=A0A2G8JZ54_STIJA|nr:hypothetical protein BSL78_22158 [Apostichopus japonicus]
MECESINRNTDQKQFSDSSKRQRIGDDGMLQMNGPTYSGTAQYSGRSFIPILTSSNTFHSEDVKVEGHTLYKPLTDDTLLNVRNVEQITFASGMFHIGNRNGAFERNCEGFAIMLWKYADSSNRLFVSRSILFTNRDEYWAVRCRLELM